MRKSAVLLAGGLSVLLAVVIAVPALGGPSILKRVKRLEHRLSATRAVAVHANHRDVRVQNFSVPMTSQGNGVWDGTADCLGEGEPTGGGVSSTGTRYLTDSIIQSYPTGAGWYAEVHSTAAGPTLRVYVACTRVGS